MIMKSQISKRLIVQSFRYSVCRYVPTKKNINKSSNTRQLFNFHDKNGNCFSSFPYSRDFTRKTLFHASASISINCQRNISNEAATINNVNNQPSAVESLLNSTNQEGVFFEWSDVTKFFSEINFDILDLSEMAFLYCYDELGVTWWSAFVLVALFNRIFVILPFTIGQIQLYARLQVVNNKLEEIEKKLKDELTVAQNITGWSDDVAKEKYDEQLVKEHRGLYRLNGYHPLKTYILPAVQVPLWLTFTLASRNLCYKTISDPDIDADQVYADLTTGGFGWITDLTVADPYMALPMALGLVNLATIEVHQLFKIKPDTDQEKKRILFFRIISVGLVPVAAFMPAATQIYWLSSSFCGLIITFFCNSRFMRSFCNIPSAVPQLEQPVKFFIRNLKTKLQLGSGQTKSLQK